jgi:hypothetical protein
VGNSRPETAFFAGNDRNANAFAISISAMAAPH